MAKKNKPLLKEGTVRRMMKLANMEALGNGFISEKYIPLEEEEVDEGTHKGQSKKTTQAARGAKKGDEAFINEQEDELEATEDELGAEDAFADEEGAEIDDLAAEEPEAEGEVTITDEEAQDIIDLADKLRDAVGDEGGGGGDEEEIEFEAEEEVEDVDLEEPGNRMYEQGTPPHEECAKRFPPGSLGHQRCMKKLQKKRRDQNEGLEDEAVDEAVDETALYEAALKGLQIDLVDDKAQQREAMLQEVKKRIYKRVVKRLLEGSKKKS